MNNFNTLGSVGRMAFATLVVSTFAAVCAPNAAAQAAAYPNKAIRMVVPYPPGGPTDLTARVVAAEMSKTLGQSIVVDNKPGASGMIGAELVARAEPDGYTFLANASLHVINPHLYPDMRFDALKDFVPITQLAAVPLVLVVPNSLPVHSIKDLVEYGKKNPGKLNFASSGSASAQHLAGESFKVAAGIEMQHIPFIKAGKLRAIAVTTLKRAQALPDLPTIAESGYPGFDVATWYGFWAPKGTPSAIVNQLSQAASGALKLQSVQEQYAGMGAEPVGSSPAEFAKYNETELAKWEKIVRASGAKAN